MTKYLTVALLAIQLTAQTQPSELGPLASEKVMAFIAVKDKAKAMSFYRDTLGLRLVSAEPIALMFDANGIILRVQFVREVSIAPYTVLGWQVADIAATAKKLQKAGVTMLRVPGLPQDELGLWKADAHTRVAWFKDPQRSHVVHHAVLESRDTGPRPLTFSNREAPRLSSGRKIDSPHQVLKSGFGSHRIVVRIGIEKRCQGSFPRQRLQMRQPG